MRIEPEISDVNVVLLGSVNPAIFTPAWFALYDILPKSVADNANVPIVHEHLSSFSTEWLQLQVTPDRFQAATQKTPSRKRGHPNLFYKLAKYLRDAGAPHPVIE